MAGLRLTCPVSRSLATPLHRNLYTSARPHSPSPSSSSSSSPRPLPSYTLFNYTLAFTLPFSFWGLFGGGGANSAGKSSTADVVSKSSTVFREQNAFVGRQQASTLMFASFKGEGRKDWQSWIGYFRDQGFDCIDANLDFEPKTGGGGGAGTGSSSSSSEGDGGAVTGKVQGEEHKILADELTSQIRLSSLQRSPLLFIHAAPSTSLLGLGSSSSSPSPISILHAHLTTRPFISGLIIVEKSAGEALSQAQKAVEAAESGSGSGEKILEEMKSKLGGRLLVVKDSEEGIKEGERWMVEKGF